MRRDYRTEAHILRQHAERLTAFLKDMYRESDYDPALLSAEQKAQLAALIDENTAVLDFTAPPASQRPITSPAARVAGRRQTR